MCKVIHKLCIVNSKVHNKCIENYYLCTIVVIMEKMDGKQFQNFLKLRLRLEQKQFAVINGIRPYTVTRWVVEDNVPQWAIGKLLDWEKCPELINDNLQRNGLLD